MRRFKDKLQGKKAKAPQGTAAGSEATIGELTERLSASNLIIPEDPEDPDGLGLKVWSEPSVDDRSHVDIVFVHGLTGKRTKTWLADGAAQPWPQELLAKDIPEARILTYGYDADVAHFIKPAGQNTVFEHATNLNGDLTDLRRRTESLDRPLIFVAHSLGGLVCEQAIVLSYHDFEAEHFLSVSLLGIIFLGTPHAGSSLSKFALALGHIIQFSVVKSPNMSNLDVLKKDSEVLAGIQKTFQTAIEKRARLEKRRLEIHCCIEENTVQGLGRRVVEPDSAAFPGYHTSSTIPADHMSMTKFQHSNQVGYKRLSDRLRRWIDDIRSDTDFHQANPISLMPFAQDKDFVGREDILTSIDEGFSQPTTLRRMALAGLGGIGKSQIAIEYAWRVQRKQPETMVFWVQANNAARFEQSYRDIATTAKITGAEDPKANILHLVNQWLSSSRSGTWLLILDNADDTDLFFGTRAAPANQADGDIESPYLSQFLPQTRTGSILITSRDEATAIRLTGGPRQVLRIDVLSEDDTFALLTNKLPREDPSHVSAKKELINELERIPLAITQASAYITINAPRMTVVKYLQLLRHGEQNQIQLLINDETDLRRDPQVPNSVIRTWQMTFSQIRIQRPEAADLLSCMCMLDRQGIPEFLVRQDGDQSLDFENAIGILLRFSLVVEEKGKNVFAIHRLVQLATLKWIETCGELEKFQGEALRLVYQLHPSGTYENWKTCEALEPHVQIILDYTYGSRDCQLQQSDILIYRARYARERGNLRESEKLAQKAINIKTTYLESDDPRVLDSLGILAMAFYSLGQLNEAEQLATHVLEEEKRVLGLEHDSTLSMMTGLAVIYESQGRLTEAEQLNLRTLEVSKRVLRAEDPSTLVTMGNLAEVYRGQGRWAEAEKLNVQILEVRRRVLGAEHPATIITMSNLATVYGDQERWTEAEKLNVQILEVQRRVLGAEHPSTLTTMNNMATVYNHQERWTEAEKLNVQILEVRRRVLGAEHPATIITMSNLATVYGGQERWTEAEKLNVQILEVERRVLGAEHPSTLITMGNLAVLYFHQERWTEAEEVFVKILEVRRKVLGAEHPDTMSGMYGLALCCHAQNCHSEAIELMEKVIELEKRGLGPEHPDTVISMDQLAKWYCKQDRYSEAIELMERVVELRKKNLGADHPVTISSMAWLAKWYYKQDRYSETIQLLERVVELEKKSLGPEHPDTVSGMHGLALCYHYQNRHNDAIELMEKVVELRKKNPGADHPDAINSMRWLAEWYHEQDRRGEAIQLLERVVELSEKSLGPEHPDTLTKMHNLSCWYYFQNRHSEAIELMEKVVEREKKNPEDHPSKIPSIYRLADWYYEQDRRGEAIQLLERVVELSEKNLGPEHPTTIGSKGDLAEWKGTQSST